MIYHVRVFLLSARVQLLEITASPFMLFNALLQPFFIAIIAIYMLRNQANFDAVYVVIGVGLSGLFGITLFTGTSAIARERSQGNLEILEASPAPLFVVLGGKMVGNLMLALSSMIMSYVVGAWIFGFTITVDSPISFSISFLMALFSLWTMGMLFAPLSILWPPVNQFLGGIEYPIFILSGFLFPVLLLPAGSCPSVTHYLPFGLPERYKVPAWEAWIQTKWLCLG